MATVRHFTRPEEYPFTKEQRDRTTMLLGGLSPVHDFLIEGALQGLGYNAKALPNTNLEAFQLGREFGNVGYCNPTYYTTGNLLRYLYRLEAEGMSRRGIIDRFVFLTIGCNAPCRFGMIEDQYRLVMQNAGFDGFRIIVVNRAGGINQEIRSDGIKANLEFHLAIVSAINMADLINELTFNIRPYELEAGNTDRVKEEVLNDLHHVLRQMKQIPLTDFWSNVFDTLGWHKPATFVTQLLHYLTSPYLIEAMRNARAKFERIEVDRLRMKPKVKMAGEFWAETTQSDGNYNMYPFLEGEGAEVLPEPVATWLIFMFSKNLMRIKERREVDLPAWWQPVRRLKRHANYLKKWGILSLGEWLYRREYARLIEALGGHVHELLDQRMLQQLADPYYDRRLEGGETYMEVAINIYYHQNHLCHMVLSMKPFGCMPSTQSDGVQAAVTEQYKDMIFLPIETSGEGEINAYSRVQMALSEARGKAGHEFREALHHTGRSLPELRAFVEAHPRLKNPMLRIPHRQGVVGTAANFIYYLAGKMDVVENPRFPSRRT